MVWSVCLSELVSVECRKSSTLSTHAHDETRQSKDTLPPRRRVGACFTPKYDTLAHTYTHVHVRARARTHSQYAEAEYHFATPSFFANFVVPQMLASIHEIVNVGITSVNGRISSANPNPAIRLELNSPFNAAASTGA